MGSVSGRSALKERLTRQLHQYGIGNEGPKGRLWKDDQTCLR